MVRGHSNVSLQSDQVVENERLPQQETETVKLMKFTERVEPGAKTALELKCIFQLK